MVLGGPAGAGAPRADGGFDTGGESQRRAGGLLELDDNVAPGLSGVVDELKNDPAEQPEPRQPGPAVVQRRFSERLALPDFELVEDGGFVGPVVAGHDDALDDDLLAFRNR